MISEPLPFGRPVRPSKATAAHVGIDPGLPGALVAVDERSRLLLAATWFSRGAGDARRVVVRWTFAGDEDHVETESAPGVSLRHAGDELAAVLRELVEDRGRRSLTVEGLFVPPGAGGGAPILETEWAGALVAGPVEGALGVTSRRVKATSWRPVVLFSGAGGLAADAAKAAALRYGPILVEGLGGALDRLTRRETSTLHHVAEAALIARWSLVTSTEPRP